MKPKLILLSLFTLGTFLFAKASTTPEEAAATKKADIIGGVHHSETKKPLASVTVTVYSAQKREKVVFTDNNGNYNFADLKEGTYKFVFEKEGYKKVTKDKVVVGGVAGIELNIQMTEHSTFDFMPSGPFHISDF